MHNTGPMARPLTDRQALPAAPHGGQTRPMLVGVCRGLQHAFGISASWLRVAFVLWWIADAGAAFVYACAFLLLPREDEPAACLRATIQRNCTHACRSFLRLQRLGDPHPGALAIKSQHSVLLGALLLAKGSLALADKLGLLGAFHLHHLMPVVLVLLGGLAMARAWAVTGAAS